MGHLGGIIVRQRRWTAMLAMTATAACVAPAPPPPPAAAARPPAQASAPSIRQLPPGQVASHAPSSLERRIVELGRSFSGSVGIAVRDVSDGWTVGYNADRPMPQQSVSKLWVAMTALDAVDRGGLSLQEPVTVTRDNLTVFHQPVRAMMGPNGYATSYGELMRIAMTQSDNTCNDMVLRRAGGPTAVRSMIERKGLGRIAFGPGETLLQSGIAGMTWRPEYAHNNGFRTARAAIPYAQRQAAMDRYLADPMDGASAEAIAGALARLQRGELLSPASTSRLLGLMRQSRTGPQRLRGGLAPGWVLAHKTGTGQDFAGLSTGYNDVGVITAPDGRSYAVAVMIASTRQSIPARQQLMNEVVRAVIASHGWNGRTPVMVSSATPPAGGIDQ
ncbi:beta-lactamase class A [Sphingomonas laterariae]|uniref:beta-lactamase n=1 Tax=Edaphosphingomonas laterariae TaxID=861865 RepID=A0A239CY23_9SPHN|nr:serine hydrolase [Sphingomonas laterariae]SNS24947.1 beta-lactamase class A [Sphingomonas laterariae]